MPLVTELLKDELRKAGVEVRNDLCEHFAYSRQELFDIVRIHRVVSFAELLASHGTGQGCEICKPAVASMLAMLRFKLPMGWTLLGAALLGAAWKLLS